MISVWNDRKLKHRKREILDCTNLSSLKISGIFFFGFGFLVSLFAEMRKPTELRAQGVKAWVLGKRFLWLLYDDYPGKRVKGLGNFLTNSLKQLGQVKY